jgi:hypothetical protein
LKGHADGAASQAAPQDRVMMPSDHNMVLHLSRCLSLDDAAPAVVALRRDIEAPGYPWPDSITAANRELLSATLWSRLRDRGLARRECAPRAVPLR